MQLQVSPSTAKTRDRFIHSKGPDNRCDHDQNVTAVTFCGLRRVYLLVYFGVNGSLGRFPEPVARFTFHHECVHLTAPDLDEVQTSCRALQHMRSSDLINHEDEAVLLRVFQDLGEIPARYLGTGARYWKAIEDCAAAITHDGPPSSANHPPPSAHLERPRDD